MNIFDAIAGSFLSIGGAVVGGAQDTKRGVFIPRVIYMNNNPHDAMRDLQGMGFDAWGVQYTSYGGLVTVKKDDREAALKALRSRGYDCWKGTP